MIAGTGYVNGRVIAAFSQDFTVAAGSVGKMHAMKIVSAMQTAARMGTPLSPSRIRAERASRKGSTPCPVTAMSSTTTS